MTPASRLAEEVAKGYPLPSTAADYGFAEPGRVSSGALVAVLGNSYSVPIEHVGAPVTVRVHRERIVIWRDAELLAEHARAPDGAHRRVVDPAHFAPLFGRKPRGQVMLYREALLGLGRRRSAVRERAQSAPAGTPRRRSAGGVCACTNAAAQPNCWRPWSSPRPRAPLARRTCGALVSAPVA